MQWSGQYATDAQALGRLLRTDASFDILQKPLTVGGRQAGLAFIDGFTKAEIMTKLLLSLVQITPEQLEGCRDIDDFMQRFVTYVETETVDTLERAVGTVLTGQLCLWIDGFAGAILIDAREYPVRGITEPEDDRILRLFFHKEGKHVVCGGTTAKIVGRFLRKPVMPVLDSGTDEIPTMASIEGVDLVTEGVITLRLLEETNKKPE